MSINPEDVVSPQKNLIFFRVLYTEDEYFSVAEGTWRDQFGTKNCLLMRWNGDEDQPKGNPISRGYPTWFVIPEEFNNAIIMTMRNKLNVSESVCARTQTFLDQVYSS